jgi:hypothetical protein
VEFSDRHVYVENRKHTAYWSLLDGMGDFGSGKKGCSPNAYKKGLSLGQSYSLFEHTFWSFFRGPLLIAARVRVELARLFQSLLRFRRNRYENELIYYTYSF